MKKIISLNTLMLMSLAIGSVSMISAESTSETTFEYSSKSKKKEEGAKRNKSAFSQDKAEMKKIEKALRNVQRKFDEGELDRKAALKELKSLEAKIKKLSTRMEKDENHGKMSEVHTHTLQRKLDEARKHVEEKSAE